MQSPYGGVMPPPPQTWLIVGASRGIGLEFVRQLLDAGNIVIATARPPNSAPVPTEVGSASKLWSLIGSPNGHNLKILECDVADEESIKRFASLVKKLGRRGSALERGIIDVVVMNAGVLVYPNRISELSFSNFAHHLHTNTIGPLITAQHLLGLASPPPYTMPTSPIDFIPCALINIRTLVFISSDSGSAGAYRGFEDGFGAYAASKAALNQGLRHLASELHRKAVRGVKSTVVLAIHPGEVTTDMAAGVNVDWDIEGIITPQESIRCMRRVIAEKGWGGVDEGGRLGLGKLGGRTDEGEATFWTWEGKRYPW